MTAPTARQLEVLVAVESSIRARGYPPSLREFSELFGWRSPRGAWDHLAALRRKGLLESDPMRARALRVTEAGRRAIGAIGDGPVIQERRCMDCGIAFFGGGCPGCAISQDSAR